MYLRFFSHVLGTRADNANCLHAGVREGSVAGILRQTLHGVLERVDCRCEVLLEDLIYSKGTVIHTIH